MVDDDDDSRDLLVLLLQGRGYRTHAAPDGRTALELLLSLDEKPCLILLDLMMPLMSGWQFREAQLQDEALKDIPVVVLTADSRAVARQDQLQAVALLPKPVNFDTLMAVVYEHCGRG